MLRHLSWLRVSAGSEGWGPVVSLSRHGPVSPWSLCLYGGDGWAQKPLPGRALWWAETGGEGAGSPWGPEQAVSIIEETLSGDALPASSLSSLHQSQFFPGTSCLGYVALSSSGGGDGGPPLWDHEAGFHPAVQAVCVLSYL